MMNTDDTEAHGPPCDYCDSDNTVVLDSIPSMTGAGHDDSWKCLDCGKTSFSGPEIVRRRQTQESKANENVFDKFMDKIILDERKNIVHREKEKSPQRIRAERHQDRPGNRIRYVRTK